MADLEAPTEAAAPSVDMEVEAKAPTERENGGIKREREEEEEDSLKKAKVEKSFEEERLVKSEEAEKEEEKEGDKKEEKEEIKEVKLGPKTFTTSVEMFDYFNKILRFWNLDYDLNKYEEMVLMDLLKKGHHEPDKKMGAGVEAFEIRIHPIWSSRCFFVRRIDGSSDDFSFRKCVDSILPLPEELRIGGKRGGGGRGGRGGWRGRGKGRGGRRN